MAKGIKRQAVAIITGASSGIGQAMAFDLAKRHQARLVINARNGDLLNETAQKVRRLGGQAKTVAGTVADDSVIGELVRTAVEAYGAIDIVVNNAGFAMPGRFTELTVAEWREVFAVNVFAAVGLTYAALPELRKNKHSKLVNIASLAGKIAFPGSVCYASSKFALTGFSEGLAAELGPQGVDVITVCPGLIRTDFFRKNKNSRDITAMAEQSDFKGWVVRNVLSISSEQASKEILHACEAGGSHEIVLTGLGKTLERLAGICPPAAWGLSRMVPSDR